MGFTPSGDGNKVNITISASDKASDDISDVQDKLERLGKSAMSVGGLMGRFEKAVGEAGNKLSSVAKQAVSTGGSFSVLKNHTNKAESKVDGLGDEAAQTDRQLDGLRGAALGAAGGMTAMSTVSTVSAVPALMSLSTVAVPLVGTLGALGTAAGGVATGFTAVIGSGMYAYGTKLKKQSKKRLKQINKKVKRLKRVRKKTGSLTKAQKKQLKTLKKQRKETKKATTVMGALGREMKPVRKQLKKTGLEMGKQFIPLIRDAIDALPQFIRNVQKAIGPLKPFAQALREIGTTAFNVFPNIVKQVMNMGRKVLPQFTKLSNSALKNVVPAMKAMQKTANRVLPLFKGMGSAFIELLPLINEFGLMLLDEIVPRVRTVISTFVKWNKKTDGMLLKAALAVSAFTTLAGVIGSVITAVGTAVTIFGTIAGLLSGPVVLAIGGVGLALFGLYKAWKNNTADIRGKVDELKNGIQKAFNFIKDDLAAVGQDILDLKDTVMSSFSVLTDEFNSLWKTVKNAFTLSQEKTSELDSAIQKATKHIGTALNTVGKVVRWLVNNVIEPMMQKALKVVKRHLGPLVREFIETFDVVMEYVEVFAQEFNKFWNEWGDEIMAITKAVFGFISLTIGTALDGILTAVRTVLALIRGDWEQAWNLVAGFLERTLGNILDYIGGDFLNGLKGVLDLVVGAIKAPFEAIYNWLIGNSLIPEMFTEVLDYIKNVFHTGLTKGLKAIKKTFVNVWGNIKKKVTQAAQKTFKSVEKKFNAAKDAVASATKKAKDKATSAFNTTKTKLDNAASGIESRFNTAKTRLTSTWGSIKSNADSAFSGVKSKVTSKVDSATSEAEDTFNGLKSWLSDTYQGQLTSNAKAVFTAVKSTLEDVTDNATSNIEDYWKSFTDWVSNDFGSSVANAFDTAFSSVASAVENALDIDIAGFRNSVQNFTDDVADAIEELNILDDFNVSINWPSPPQIVKDAIEGNLNIGSQIKDALPDYNFNPGGGSSSGSDSDSSDSSGGSASTTALEDAPSIGEWGENYIWKDWGDGIAHIYDSSDMDELLNEIPFLADGGVVTDATTAMVGEGSESEAVMPLSKLNTMMEREYRAGAQTSQSGSQQVDVRLKVEGDDELTRLIRDNAEVVVDEKEQNKSDRLRRFE